MQCTDYDVAVEVLSIKGRSNVTISAVCFKKKPGEGKAL
jgi:hypothetical protein